MLNRLADKAFEAEANLASSFDKKLLAYQRKRNNSWQSVTVGLFFGFLYFVSSRSVLNAIVLFRIIAFPLYVLLSVYTSLAIIVNCFVGAYLWGLEHWRSSVLMAISPYMPFWVVIILHGIITSAILVPIVISVLDAIATIFISNTLATNRN